MYVPEKADQTCSDSTKCLGGISDYRAENVEVVLVATMFKLPLLASTFGSRLEAKAEHSENSCHDSATERPYQREVSIRMSLVGDVIDDDADDAHRCRA